MTIFHSKDTKIGYIEEVLFGSIPASPTMQPITLAAPITRGLDYGNIVVSAVGYEKPPFILKGPHEPILEIEFNIQNISLSALVENLTKSYSLVVLDATGTDKYQVYEGCRVGGLRIATRVREEVMGTITMVPRSLRDEASISGLSWGSEWSETPFAWYDGRIELLTEVLGESPSGSGTGPYTCTYSPFCDKNEDGDVDDTGDIIVYDDGTPEVPASVDSSAGTFMLTESPAGAVTVDYVYETALPSAIDLSMVFENSMERVLGIGLTGDKARAIREGGVEVTGDLTYTVEDSVIIDAILTGTSYWGFQLKLGAGENGTLRLRAKDDFQWGTLDLPSDVDSILTGRVGFSANDYNIF